MTMLTPLGVRDKRHSGAGRRVLSVVLVIVVLAAGAFAAWWFLVRQSPTPTRVACPPPPTAAKPLPAPVAAKTVKLNVYNATARSGLAGSVSTIFSTRGFGIGAVSNDPAKRKVTAAAEIRHGPKGVRAARTVGAHVDGTVVMVPDRRTDATVDIVLGAAWTKVRTPQAAAAALKPARATPVARPPGC